MRLLLDENLSFRICRYLSDLCEAVHHVRDFGLLQTDDRLIWDFARERGYAIVTQDEDFVGRVIVDGAPPKIVWVRVSDAPVRRYIELLRASADTIRRFLTDPDAVYLEIPRSPLD